MGLLLRFLDRNSQELPMDMHDCSVTYSLQLRRLCSKIPGLTGTSMYAPLKVHVESRIGPFGLLPIVPTCNLALVP
jgi:hypothetical protein